jgi:putative peptidoglycan lipid II flippase
LPPAAGRADRYRGQRQPDPGHTDRYSPGPGFGSPEPSGQPGYPAYPDDELTSGGGWTVPYDQSGRPRYREPQPTKALPIGAPPDAIPIADAALPTGTSSVLKSSSVMAVGTLGSRLTGFLRTIAQSWALGVAGIGAAYNLANTLPNVVYNLALGGILTSVIVPLIVNARRRDTDRGEAYEQRMFTLATGALLAITVVATIAAVPIVHLYSGSTVYKTPGELHLAIIFALFFIPQIFFYGISSLIGAILNTRGSFAAPMWTPIVNNFVVIAVLGLYVAVAGVHRTPTTISATQMQLLGLGTTLGIVAQTAALVPALRKVGFRWQPRMDFRRAEVAEIGRMGGWMFAYIAATQVAFLITTRLAGDNASGITDYNYAWLLFQLPYAVVGISVITALLPRMSAHASAGQLSLVRDDFSAGIRLASVIVVPSSLVLAVLGPALAEIFLGHGATVSHGAHPLAAAHYIGVVFAVFCFGLLPYMIFQLQLRVFYSLHDSKTPALIGAATTTLNIIANLVALAVLPNRDLVAGLGVGFGLANVLGTILAWRVLSRRLGGLDGTVIGSTLGRMYAATIPAALVAVLVSVLVEGFGPRTSEILSIVVGGGVALIVYVVFARVLQVTELTGLGRTLRTRLGR